MNRHLALQIELPFVHTTNSGIEKHFIPVSRVQLIEFKGPLAGDKQKPHDIAVRAAGNRVYGKKPYKKLTPAQLKSRAGAWMASHPVAYEKFAAEALKVARVCDHYGAKAIAEYIRHHEKFNGGPDYKLPNNVVTYMARRFAEEHPEHANLFKSTKRK